MLAFDVINLEHHRAPEQNAARMDLRHSHGSELPPNAPSSSGTKPSKLNRQIPEIKPSVTSRKQTTETSSNRQKFQKRWPRISNSTSLSSARDFDASATRKEEPLVAKNEAVLAKWAPTSNRKWRANRCYRKQTIKPCLTEARTHFRESAFCRNFRISATALSDRLMFHPAAPRTIFPSSNLSETYGRS